MIKIVLISLLLTGCVIIYKSNDPVVIKNRRQHEESFDNKEANSGGNTTNEAVTRSDIKTLETNIQKGLKNTQKSLQKDIEQVTDTIKVLQDK